MKDDNILDGMTYEVLSEKEAIEIVQKITHPENNQPIKVEEVEYASPIASEPMGELELTPEAKAEIEKQEAEMKAKVEAMMKINLAWPKFSCNSLIRWREYVEANDKDDYGKACLVYANEWAAILDELLIKHNTIDVNDLSDEEIYEAGKKADEVALGITGFMYGMVIAILGETWKHGRSLVSWHNKQYDQPECEGVINPAVITIGE